MLIRLSLLALGGILGLGCQSKYANLPIYQPPAPTTQPEVAVAPVVPQTAEHLRAIVAPPAGWTAAPLEKGKEHIHQTWVSPTHKTAYGVIYFGLPLPMPAHWLMGPFIDEMKKREGKADVLGQPYRDESLPGVRIVVETKLYKMHMNLIVRGFSAWAIYSGVDINKEESPAEIKQAETAREQTKVGLDTSNK